MFASLTCQPIIPLAPSAPRRGAARPFGFGGQAARGRPLPNSEAGVGVHARSRCETRAFPDIATGRPKATGNTVAPLSSKVTRLFHGCCKSVATSVARFTRRKMRDRERARARVAAGVPPAAALRAKPGQGTNSLLPPRHPPHPSPITDKTCPVWTIFVPITIACYVFVTQKT